MWRFPVWTTENGDQSSIIHAATSYPNSALYEKTFRFRVLAAGHSRTAESRTSIQANAPEQASTTCFNFSIHLGSEPSQKGTSLQQPQFHRGCVVRIRARGLQHDHASAKEQVG